jgi:hypothetical protein
MEGIYWYGHGVWKNREMVNESFVDQGSSRPRSGCVLLFPILGRLAKIWHAIRHHRWDGKSEGQRVK